MKYALIIYEKPEQMSRRDGPDAPAYWEAWSAFGKALADAGVAAGGAGLQTPDTATTVRLDERHEIHDGPYADSKEMLGGFFIIDVPDLDQALAWAGRAPTPGGRVEVRPLIQMPG